LKGDTFSYYPKNQKPPIERPELRGGDTLERLHRDILAVKDPNDRNLSYF